MNLHVVFDVFNFFLVLRLYKQKAETNGSRKPSMDTTVQVYAKSWVFEGTGVDAYHQPGDSCSASICSSSSPTNNIISNHSKNQSHKKGHSSKLSDANSERFPQAAMTSFSRCATPSPIPYSGQATPTNIIYADYLGATPDHRSKSTRLTVDYVQSVDVAIAPDATVVTPKLVVCPKPKTPKLAAANKSNGSGSIQSSISTHQEDSQYASMLAELEQSLIEKKIQATNNMSPDDTSVSTDKFGSSKSSSKDLEFSKELEAALQLIQDLETPSEGPADDGHIASSSRVARSESEKTLSAAVSLPSPEQGPYKLQSPEAQTPQNGKHDDSRNSTNVIHIEPSSQSTSGYSSPSSSYASNVRLSNASNSVCGNSTTDDQSYVVRIYIEQDSPSSTPAFNTLSKMNPKSKDCTKSTGVSSIITSNNKPKKPQRQQQQQQQSTDAMNKYHPLFKKRPKAMLDSDFQNLIFKPECLAYLTDEELVARHKCNRDVIRVRRLVRFIPLCIQYRLLTQLTN